jgi:hypothetical protein
MPTLTVIYREAPDGWTAQYDSQGGTGHRGLVGLPQKGRTKAEAWATLRGVSNMLHQAPPNVTEWEPPGQESQAARSVRLSPSGANALLTSVPGSPFKQCWSDI